MQDNKKSSQFEQKSKTAVSMLLAIMSMKILIVNYLGSVVQVVDCM